MSHQGFDITFKEFKENFYSKIGDGSCLNVLDINLLKVVLDGLKVKYTSRGKIAEYLTKPLAVTLIFYFFKIFVDLKKKASLRQKTSKLRNAKYITAFSDRTQNVNGKVYSYYFQNIYERYGRDKFCYMRKKPISDLHAEIDYNDLIFDLDVFKGYNFKLLLELRKHLRALKRSDKWTKDELDNIGIAYFLFLNEYLKYDAFLKRTKFECAIIDCHYHDEGFILACKKNNVKVIELQHGLISKEDIFFVFPEQVKASVSKALFADHILVYGRYWKEVLLNGTEYKDEQIGLIGYYPFDEEEGGKLQAKQKKSILVTTQYSIASYYIDYVRWLSPKLSNEWEIIVKVHPIETVDIYDELLSLQNVKVTDTNLNALIESSEFIISIFSTTLFDAVHHEKPAFALNIDFFKDYVADVVSTNAIFLLDPNEDPVKKFNSIDPSQQKLMNSLLYADFDASVLDELLNVPSSKKTNRNSQFHDAPIMNKERQSCTNCVLTTDDTNYISFDERGMCNYCNYYYAAYNKLGDANTKEKWLKEKVSEMKANRGSHGYDSILGVSGGVDSTYLAYWAKQNNLNPLVVHFDNGWDSELAVKNIEKICSKLEFQLHTYVINWEEFKELQLAYFKAGVIDIEVLTDHAISASLFRMAKKYKIKYILNGNNLPTEAIMPKDWVYDKNDWRNIKDIYSKFGNGKPIRTFPRTTFPEKLYNYWFLKLENLEILNYIDYDKEKAKQVIINELDWIDYGGKHYESIFTKFYQSYILPTKFNVDKRKAHLATLICSKQVTKNQALEQMKLPLYDPKEMQSEKQYVLKKLGLNESEFDDLMKAKPRDHSDFKNEKELWTMYFKFISILKFRRLRK